MMTIKFVKLDQHHFSLMHKWLETPHVRSWWDKDIQWTSELIQEKFATYAKGYKLEKGLKKSISAYVIYMGEAPIGYIQLYNAYDFSREDGVILEGLPRSLAAIDFFVGEVAHIGKGLGDKILDEFIGSIVFPSFDACFVDPDSDNLAAIRTYEKAGFKKIREVLNGKALWMTRWSKV